MITRMVLLVVIGLGVVLLATIAQPAGYLIDITRMELVSDITEATSTRTIKITDVIGGNEQLRTIALPPTGGQVPLPDPAVYQDDATSPQTRMMQIAIP